MVLLVACSLARAFPAATWIEEDDYKWRPLDIATDGRPGFTMLDPSDTSIRFKNRLDAEKSLQNQVYLNGSGVALGDIDGDGQ